MTEISRSPYRISARVRGIGVADMTRMWGSCPFSARAERWATPKRCCSSAITRPRLEKSVASAIRAWVPMMKSTLCSAISCRAALFCAGVMEPVSRAVRTPRGSISCFNDRACCSARISVGAIMAAWIPFFAASQAAAAATTVLPLPTSPWTSRFITLPLSRSPTISATARFWALVSL